MKYLIGAGILSFACATSAQSKMPLELFAKIAGDWYATEQCAFEGRMKPETAAYGKQLLRQSLDKYQADMELFGRLVEGLRKKMKMGLPDPKICNTMAMQIEEIKLEVAAAQDKVKAEAEQQRREAAARAQIEQQKRLDAEAKAKLEELQRRQAEFDAAREERERQAEAAYRRQQAEAMVEQIKQMGQQMQDFGNSVNRDAPRTTNCTRTFTGVSCVTY